jgi:cell division protein FtsB
VWLVAMLKRSILPALILVAIYVAVFGGEYSVFELRATRAATTEERSKLAELHRQIDSLYAWADSLQVDPFTLERIARERYGMIREGETLYRFVEGDSTAAGSGAKQPAR